VGEEGGPAGLSVLVADASEAERTALTVILERLGCRCDSAADGAAAVEQAAARAYDLVLVDVDLPVLSGAQCREAIAGLPGRHGQTPVVGIAPAGADAARLARHRGGGFAAMLQRPLQAAEVLACLRAQARPAGPPAVDLEHLRRYTLGDGALERELFQAFLPNAAAYLERMAAAGDDGRVWRDTAHALKGAARGLGAFALGDLAERAERQPAETGDACRELLAEMRRALAGVEAFAAAHLDRRA
jgi:CheY-like chemotaxis protein